MNKSSTTSDTGLAATTKVNSTTEQLRILRVATDLHPEVLGGGAIHAHRMSVMQAEMGHDVTVLTSDHGNRSLPQRESRDGYTLRRYREVARPFGNSLTPKMVTDLHRLCETFDLVHAHSHLYLSTNVAAALAQLNDVPFVVTNHGLYSQSAPEWLQTTLLHTLWRSTFNAADRVFCYTETDRSRLRNVGVDAPVSVISNGIDCKTFAPAVDQREPQILFVGRLKKAKGVHWLVEAFGNLADKFPQVTLSIVGSGPLSDELEERAANLGLTDRIDFHGRVPNDELPEVYSKSQLFVLPSKAEGLPRTVLEALACETPVVTSNLPQLEPLVEGAGLTVPVGEVNALQKAIQTFLGDEPRRAQAGTIGRERVVENYSWAETVEETTEVYYDVV